MSLCGIISVHCPNRNQVPLVLKSTFKFRILTHKLFSLWVSWFHSALWTDSTLIVITSDRVCQLSYIVWWQSPFRRAYARYSLWCTCREAIALILVSRLVCQKMYISVAFGTKLQYNLIKVSTNFSLCTSMHLWLLYRLFADIYHCHFIKGIN